MKKGFKSIILVFTAVLTVFAFANVFSFDSRALVTTGSSIQVPMFITTPGGRVQSTATISTTTPGIEFMYDSSDTTFLNNSNSFVTLNQLTGEYCATCTTTTRFSADTDVFVVVSISHDGATGTFGRLVTGQNGTNFVFTSGIIPSCGGAVPSETTTAEESYMKSTERFANEIADASALATTSNKNVKVEYSTGSALPTNIMRAMTESKNVTLEYTFEFLGYKFKTTITPEAAQKAFKEDIPWYGPYYLASNFQTVVVGVAD